MHDAGCCPSGRQGCVRVVRGGSVPIGVVAGPTPLRIRVGGGLESCIQRRIKLSKIIAHGGTRSCRLEGQRGCAARARMQSGDLDLAQA